MGDWQPDRQVTLDVPEKAIGRDKRSTVHLWVVPAAVQGLWCTAGASLAITQRFQAFSATLSTPGAAAPLAVFDGRVATDQLQAGTDAQAGQQLRLVGNTLQWLQATGPAQRFIGRSFERAGQAGCR
jgi:hypothetical protein